MDRVATCLQSDKSFVKQPPVCREMDRVATCLQSDKSFVGIGHEMRSIQRYWKTVISIVDQGIMLLLLLLNISLYKYIQELR